MEDSINLEELDAIVLTLRKREHRQLQGQAALKGIEIGDFDEEDREASLQRAVLERKAELTGKSVEQLDLEQFGIGVIESDE